MLRIFMRIHEHILISEYIVQVHSYKVSQGLSLIHEENVGRDKLLPPQDNLVREGRFTPDASA